MANTQAWFAAVFDVPHERMTHALQVDAQLVRSAANQFELNQGVRRAAAKYFITSERGEAAFVFVYLHAHRACVALLFKACADFPFAMPLAPNDAEVCFFYPPLPNLASQNTQTRLVFAEQHDARGVAIQPIDWRWKKRPHRR